MAHVIRELWSAFGSVRFRRAVDIRALPPEPRTIEKLTARLQQQSDSAHEARTSVAALQTRLAIATARLEARRRSSLNQDVLAQLLPIRAGRRFILPEDPATACVREQQLLQRSNAYRAISSDTAARQRSLQCVQIAGMAWWIPIDDRAPQRAERAVAQGFPLRAILQTRELSIGGVMLDIGANIGRTAIPRVLLGDVRVVYAAEPEPANYACLVQNVIEHGLRGVVLPHHLAIGAMSGDVTLRQSRYAGGHRVLALPTRKPVPTVTVPMLPVDAWLSGMDVDPDTISFVKVDTQGSEVNVLTGAAGLLARRRASWQIEIDPALLEGAGTTAADLMTLIQAHFTHFIDLGSAGRGPRVRPTAALPEAVAYLGTAAAKTDILVYSATIPSR